MNVRIAPFAAAFACLATAATAQVVPAGSVRAQSVPKEDFTGAVKLRPLTKAAAPGQAGAGLVQFPAGARSNWHTHPAGQILYVTEGCGWTQEEAGPVRRICKGDTVYAKPGVKHWHGATDKTAMSHLAITETVDGKNVEWLEPVSAAQFRRPAK